MPVYCYTRQDDGKTVEIQMTCAEMEERQDEQKIITLDDGVKAQRNYTLEHKTRKNTGNFWRQGLESDAAAVHPEQVAECEEACAKAGIPTEYNKETGTPIFTGRSHRRKFCRWADYYDQDAGYSDPAPKNA